MLNSYLPADKQDADSIAQNYDEVILGKLTPNICPACSNYMHEAEALDGWDDTVDILECAVCGYQDSIKE